MKTALTALAAIAITLAACTPGLPTQPSPTPAVDLTILPTDPPPSPTPAPEPLYLNLVWHQHQPLYYTDPQTSLITRPWVRVHATKDYYDMAAILKNYPKVKATFNLTPVLIKQLDDLANGARDVYWELGAKPANQLNEDDKRFILQRFFDANANNVIGTYPRYKELMDKRAGASPEQIDAALRAFSEQDFRDLQVWFNLAWFDPDFLAEPPLKDLVAKGRDFIEADKQALFNKALDVIRGVIPLHKQMQDEGQIEVITTPYAHPILPLVINTNLARVGDPKAQVPQPPFDYPQDAVEHLKRSVEIYQQHYGRAPRGLWPGEGAVALDMVELADAAGYQWMASGEQVLARTLSMDGFTRDGSDMVQQADKLYRPYYIEAPDGAKVAVVFRDSRLSDLIGFEYGDMDGEAAAQDLMDRLARIRAQLKEGAIGPHLVSIILDGENAWENYPNDGKAFFNALYQKLSDAADHGEIQTITPSEYLAKFPDQQSLQQLWAGAWFSPDYATWIGEPEENTAWSYLLRTRRFLDDFLTGKKPAEQSAIDQAREAMLLAEGSDWLWWYGGDQDSGDDGYFDRGFRALLAQVYQALGAPVPEYANVPIIAASVASPAQILQGVITPTIDGAVVEGEWELAGAVGSVGSMQGQNTARPLQGESPVAALYYGINPDAIVFRADATQDWNGFVTGGQPLRLGVYFKMPVEDVSAALSRLSTEDVRRAPLGMSASHLLEWTLGPRGTASAVLYKANGDGGWSAVTTTARAGVESAATGQVMEMSAPLAFVGEADELKAGDSIQLVALVSQGGRALGLFPVNGIAQMVVP